MSYTNGLDKPEDYFNTVLWTGTGSTQSVTGVGFQPDWVWLKSRNASADHGLWDNVRGVQKLLSSNQPDAESTTSGLTSFDSDGFTLGSANSNFNFSGRTMVGWNWLASNTTASNTDGSITSTVSANTTSGFSIVKYTGTGSNATVGHLLGAVPKIIFFKDRETSVDWGVYAEAIGNGNELYLSTSDSAGANSGAFNSTSPTSSVFTIGTSSRYNPSSKGVIAYCFAEKKGFSKFGSYTGNGSTDGTFIYTGFKPAFFMLKNTDAAENWTIRDTKRTPYNVGTVDIFPNLSNAETTSGGGNFYDILSNGVKLRGADARQNQSGQNYIYMAFAENPFTTSTGIPTTAR